MVSPTDIQPDDWPGLVVAILGNPCVHPDWSEDEVEALCRAGFNAVQLNIAWGRRPNDEPLNLRDVVSPSGEPEEPKVARWREQLRHRVDLARRFGLRTLFHFGSPFMFRNPATGELKRDSPEAFHDDPPWFDSLNPAVVEHETGLLQEFRRQFPDVDDILVYTYDQDAWQASEFATSRYSRGIPLHERLPGYLEALHRVWIDGREDEDHWFWWEPWELSAGQVYGCIPRLPANRFGLMLHGNIAEAMIAHPVDVWFRNTARMCRDRGIPVVAEGFFTSMTEEIEDLSIPCPRLTDEEVLALTSVPGVIGLKEYFGVLPRAMDLNLDMFRERLADPESTTEGLIDRITRRFGDQQSVVRDLLASLSDAIQVYPWDASWFARKANWTDIDHGWTGATVRGLMVETPSWRSTRAAHFMMIDDRQPHPFLLEDVQLRCEQAAEYLARALERCKALVVAITSEGDRELIQQIARDADRLRRVATSYALHLRETNVAMLLRQDAEEGRTLTPRLVDEMRRLLKLDVENQRGQGRVVEMKRRFEEDPADFLRHTLVPTEETVLERGHHTFTTR